MTSNIARELEPTRRFLFLLASGRENGNAEVLAHRAAATLPTQADLTWIRLADVSLGRFTDIRHVGSGVYPAPIDTGRELLDATLAATDLVFVAPLYWYGLPADAKLYLDHWSGWMRIPELNFRARMAGKTMWAISVFSGDDDSEAAPLFECLQRSAAYLQMHWGGQVLGRGNRPGDVLDDQRSVAATERLFV